MTTYSYVIRIDVTNDDPTTRYQDACVRVLDELRRTITRAMDSETLPDTTLHMQLDCVAHDPHTCYSLDASDNPLVREVLDAETASE